jgi:peptidyl-prolyl isomerase D
VLSPDDPSLLDTASADGDVYEDYPDDEDRDVRNPEIALDIAKAVREIGNKLFKEGKIDLALEKYQSKCEDCFFFWCARSTIALVPQESIRYLDVRHALSDDSSPELKNSFNALLAPLLLNSALAAIRAEPPSTQNAKTAVENTTKALDTLELNTSDQGMTFSKNRKRQNVEWPFTYLLAKALYRRALANIVLKEDDSAEKDLVRASELVPDDKAILSELAKLTQRKKEKREKEKKAFKKMFAWKLGLYYSNTHGPAVSKIRLWLEMNGFVISKNDIQISCWGTSRKETWSACLPSIWLTVVRETVNYSWPLVLQLVIPPVLLYLQFWGHVPVVSR